MDTVDKKRAVQLDKTRKGNPMWEFSACSKMPARDVLVCTLRFPRPSPQPVKRFETATEFKCR